MKEIVCAGFGGQGVLTAGLILSDIAVQKGLRTTWMPAYGSAMRGGTANCTVKYGADMIYNPAQEEPDLLLAMNAQSFQAFLPIVRPGGLVLLGDGIDPAACARTDIRLFQIPCMQMAEELGHARGANIVMTGAMVRLLGDFSREEGLASMNRMFEKKGKGQFEAQNTAAYLAGYSAADA